MEQVLRKRNGLIIVAMVTTLLEVSDASKEDNAACAQARTGCGQGHAQLTSTRIETW
jgi:hypothetical protein